MADSAVRFQAIDEEFPVPGQDNDSQGFRDNFSEIKQALESANSELTDLLNSVVRKDSSNDFNGNSIENASIRAVSSTVYKTANLDSDTRIEWVDGLVQEINVHDNITITLAAFPVDREYGKMRLIFKSDGAAGGRTVNLENGTGGNLFIKSDNYQDALTDGVFKVGNVGTDTGNPIRIIDAWTYNQGNDVYLEYIGKFANQL